MPNIGVPELLLLLLFVAVPVALIVGIVLLVTRRGKPATATTPMPAQPQGANVVAGWYPDPNIPGHQRYWDGTAWTTHTVDADAPGGRHRGPPE